MNWSKVAGTGSQTRKGLPRAIRAVKQINAIKSVLIISWAAAEASSVSVAGLDQALLVLPANPGQVAEEESANPGQAPEATLDRVAAVESAQLDASPQGEESESVARSQAAVESEAQLRQSQEAILDRDGQGKAVADAQDVLGPEAALDQDVLGMEANLDQADREVWVILDRVRQAD